MVLALVRLELVQLSIMCIRSISNLREPRGQSRICWRGLTPKFAVDYRRGVKWDDLYISAELRKPAQLPVPVTANSSELSVINDVI